MKTTHNTQPYKTSDDFTEIIAHLVDASSELHLNTLCVTCFDSPLGAMIAIGDERELYQLQFADYYRLQRDVEKLKQREKANLILKKTAPLIAIEKELTDYFQQKHETFNTALHIAGSDFQKTVWQQLMQIPYGEVKSYSEQAEAIGKPTAYRAVANANGVNQFVIIIPCHRIINHNGNLGGYGGGLDRKQWLLAHEQRWKE